MSILVVRHGLSEANNRKNIGTPAFGSRNAELMREGREQARKIPEALLSRFAITASGVTVATSTLLRTQQTAQEAGFVTCRQYEELDEIEPETLGINRLQLRAMLDQDELPKGVLDQAATTLESPPREAIWFSHGLRIAGICALLGEHQDERLIPKFCEIRELTL